MERGFKLVRPLAGGLDAWVAAGFPVEEFGEERRDRAAAP
jgi:3-mercaptopyruvate sulfurtransferase SseA